MGYQNFPWQAGGSRSFEKLISLSLPVLQGKSVLDVGCNAGYFCGWAAFQRAAWVKGIDSNPAFIDQARTWFSGCSFACTDWRSLGPERFDVILCLSAIHYADDQQQFIDMLMKRLNPDGVLVLELGIAAGDEDVFVPVKRAISQDVSDTRLFPTRTKLQSMLTHYAFKYMGLSVQQAGDPTPRHVYHIYHARPMAVLLMDEHYSGKTSVVSALMKPDIFRIFGEKIYHDIADGRVSAGEELKAHIQYMPDTQHMIPPQITHAICAAGLLPQLAAVYTGLAGKKDFILEQYIPYDHRLELCEIMYNAGFFVVDVALYAAHKKPWTLKRPPYARYLSYLDHLTEMSDIDEAAYLEANPDVAAAVARGDLPSGQYHYWHFGKHEKRKCAPDAKKA